MSAMHEGRVFLDTNTLLYLHARNDDGKAATDREWMVWLIEHQSACVNLQVLNEATNAMLRKRWFQTPQQVYAIIDRFAELGDASLGWPEIALARALHAGLSYSWWDCLLLASALELGCTYFLSEDLQDGHTIPDGSHSLTIINPFAHSPGDILTHH